MPDFVLPKERLNEVASFVRGGLQDLSISRTTFDWGIPVPGNPKHIMYVWVDALTNYITAVGFPDTDSEKFRRYWPADLHVIGKDIVRFHAVYWPAFLMSAGIEVPRRIFSHGFLFNRGEKMSKSVGNVIDPFALADAYGVDPLRYFFLREVPFGQDGNYSHEAIVNRINADLANDLGNLAQRSLTMVARKFGGVLPQPGAFSDADKAILAAADAMIGKAREAMKTQQLHQVLNAVWAVVADANRYFAGEAPWALAKTDPARQGTVLYVTAEVIAAGRDPGAAVHAGVGGKAARSVWRCRPASATFAALGGDAPHCARREAAGAGAGVSALCRAAKGARRRNDAMLVDSHCHLDFPGFRRRARRRRRARARGRHRAPGHDLDARRAATPTCWRSPSAFPTSICSVGTHPHHAHEELDVDGGRPRRAHAPSQGRGDRRGRARLSLRQQPARRAGARLPQPHRGGARNRAAAGHPFARGRRRHGAHPRRGNREGRLPGRAALLHRRAAILPRRAIALGLFISFTGILTFKNSDDAARHRGRAAGRPHPGRDRRALSRARPASAASATSRPMWSRPPRCWRRRAASRSTRSRGRPRDNFFRLFAKVPRPGAAAAA